MTRKADQMTIRKLATAKAIMLLLLVSPAAFAMENMTIDFSWKGIPGCRGGSGTSPAFEVRNAPAATRSLLFTLNSVSVVYEFGGSTVAYPSGGNVPPGAVYANSPCNPGNYEWTVVAFDGGGTPLATAKKARQFPH